MTEPISDSDLDCHKRMIASPSCAEEDISELLAPLVARIDAQAAELAGYKHALAQQAEAGTSVFLVTWDGNVGLRVFGPDPDREQAFAETLGQWITLNWTAQDHGVLAALQARQPMLEAAHAYCQLEYESDGVRSALAACYQLQQQWQALYLKQKAAPT